MTKVLDYDRLAKKRDLELKIADLNRARLQALEEDQAAVRPVNVDVETLKQEIETVSQNAQETCELLRQQEVNDLLAQAREGSRYIAVERKLMAQPHLLQDMDLTPLQNEQTHYQHQTLEILDYLVKYFAQFQMDDQVALPESGVRFFDQVATKLVGELAVNLRDSRELLDSIAQERKNIQKAEHKEQRILRGLQDQISDQLEEKDYSLNELIAQNVDYQALAQEIETEKVLINSQLNEINVLINQSLSLLEEQKEIVGSILGQNKVTRVALAKLKANASSWQRQDLQERVREALQPFDARVEGLLQAEIEKRYDEVLSDPKKEDFFALIDEMLSFQEYLGQIFADSFQVLVSNVDDLWQKRANYGKIVLDFLAA